MASRLTVRLMDVIARVVIAESAAPTVSAEVTDAWSDLEIGGDLPHDLVVAVASDDGATPPEADLSVGAQPEDSLGERLASQLTLAALERMSGRAVMLHAGAVALDDGSVIGFVGPSGRGKTTAMTVLGRTHRYVTDETLVIADDGSVTPYPKPLLIGRRPEAKRAYSASSLGLRPVGGSPLRLARLVLLDRRQTAGPLSVTEVPLVDAIIELAGESSYLSAISRPLRTLADLLAATGGARRLTYSEAATLPDALQELMSGSPKTPSDLESIDPLPQATPSPGWTRAPYTDALLIDGRLLVLHEQTITVLDGIAPALWRAATGVSVEQLTRAALREHPAPSEVGDPGAIVAAMVEELALAGLLLFDRSQERS
jgi:hypothetical protein